MARKCMSRRKSRKYKIRRRRNLESTTNVFTDPLQENTILLLLLHFAVITTSIKKNHDKY